MPRIVSAVALVAVLAPAFVLAQGVPAPASTVPAAIVTALMFEADARVDAGASYFVSELPADWPATVKVPAWASVVGGMATRGARVALFQSDGSHSLAAFDSVFEQAGWLHPREPFRGNGFQAQGHNAVWFCRDSAYLSASRVPSADGRGWVHVRFRPASESTECSRSPAPAAVHFLTAIQIPRLLPPAGSTSSGGGSYGSSDEQRAATSIESTSLTAKQLLDHYAAQLVAAGWTALPAAFTDRGALQSFDARDSRGAPWTGTFVVTARGKTLDVSLVMNRVKG